MLLNLTQPKVTIYTFEVLWSLKNCTRTSKPQDSLSSTLYVDFYSLKNQLSIIPQERLIPVEFGLEGSFDRNAQVLGLTL